jgi:hypothetical protein
VETPASRTYDPIALRKATVAARAALGLDADGKPARTDGGTGAGRNPGEQDPDAADLTPAELSLLTDFELKNYEGSSGASNRAEWNRKLRQLIRSENRTAYAPPEKPEEFTAEQFKQLPPWHQRRFCAEFVNNDFGIEVAQNDRNAPGFEGEGRALQQLIEVEARKRKERHQALSGSRAAMREKFGGPCAALGRETLPTIDPGTGSSDHRADIPTPTGADKEEAAKDEKKPPSDHAFNAMRGAILGALIGSLFGPFGAILGAAIGGAAMYGFSKWKNPDKEE